MNNLKDKIFLVISLIILSLSSCEPSPHPTAIPQDTPTTFAQPTTITLPTSTALPTSTLQGETITVISAGDSGPGTLRQALLDAQSGDIITFDPTIFPPDNPVFIMLNNGLDPTHQGYITVDASNAGVVLDGSNILEGDWVPGLQIHSDGNIIWGLQIVNFSGPGILVGNDSVKADHNTIGGDRDIGSGPIGQGNLLSSNSNGVGLINASNNTIAGNLIGTDITGMENVGNQFIGIFLDENSSHNIIGPNNTIAYNGVGLRCGIEIRSETALENRITRNSIHDNSSFGICPDHDNGISTTPPPPVILGFDIETGWVEGYSCSQCIVEIFSTSSMDGEIFEGQVIAEDNGYFSFSKDKALSGPRLTATTIDIDGNTSEFSLPTSGTRKLVALQESNNYAVVQLQHKPSNELEDNHLGSLWSGFHHYGVDDFQALIDHGITTMGLKQVKTTINEAEYFTNSEVSVSIDWSKPELSIPPEFDDFVTDLVSNDITIIYQLIFWDKANHPEGWGVQPRFKTEEEISRYLEYVRFIVSHFKGRVRYYELWNEPNIPGPLQYIEPEDYNVLAQRAIPVIKEIDPQAKVVVGSTSGSVDPGSREYLFKILKSDLMPMADVVSWHPLYGEVPGSGPNPEYYASYPSLLAEIMDTAKRNGFQGEFFAGEINYQGPASEDGGQSTDHPFFSDIIAAKYTARGIILHLGNGARTGVSVYGTLWPGVFVQTSTTRNIANIFAGASADVFDVEIRTDAQNVKTFMFTKSDGSKLLAIWTDGAAVENDPGVQTTLTIPGFSEGKVTGIDTLYGYDQQLITSTENGNLLIRGFLIKDYPIILRIVESASP